MRTSEPIGLAKAILWEEAKGKLRALAAAEGATHGGQPDQYGVHRYQAISKRVERFIEKFEADGLQE
jgi:hypothetical protein